MNDIGTLTLFFIGLSGLISLLFLVFIIWIYFNFHKTFERLENNIQKIIEFTNTDPLTNLPNRELFLKNIKKILYLANHDKQKVAILFMDIDNFRGIKDTLGHATGEALLEAVAKKLLQLTDNRKEVLARLGSDQFIIILENAHNEKIVYDFAKQVLRLFEEPFNLNGHEQNVTAAIGICLYPDHGNTIDDLLKNSGIARYQAKKEGNNTFCFYTLDMDRKFHETRTIENQLRNAISKGELVVCYQPKIDITTNKIVGAEALLQWNNPKLGRIPPSQFIPLAEQCGLIVPIGNWVLKESCLQTIQWHAQGFENFSIAVNFSAHQLRSGDFIGKIAQATLDIGLNPELLEVELTESLIMENIEKSLLMLKVLKTMGIKVSIDDFGTGYSSLSHLKKFPVDYLKIDQSFIRNISKSNPDDNAIVNTIITMAKQMNIKVIAEGVETEEQLEYLKEAGCNLVQGFLFSKPVPADQFTQLLIKNAKQYGKQP